MTTSQEITQNKGFNEWQEPETGMDFVWISGDKFKMGSGEWDPDSQIDELPVHEVRLDGFWMAKFPVTVGQYLMGVNKGSLPCPAWMEEGGRYNIATGENNLFKSLGRTITDDFYPVTGVSWDNALAYARWLSKKTGLQFGLPTEAQWEFAARSGGKKEKYAGSNKADEVAWYNFNSDDSAHPVGEKKPNGIGLYDMCGNVCEWCLDLYNRFAYEIHEHHNPINTENGSCRVVRGGSWNYGARDIRCADRGLYVPEYRGNDLGFRLIRTP